MEAITWVPAVQAGIENRVGRLAPGLDADLVLFDPQTVRDVASFSDPKQPADGIEAVMVNGVMSYGSDKKIIGRAGRFLRRQMN